MDPSKKKEPRQLTVSYKIPRVEVIELMVEKIHKYPDHKVDPDEPTDIKNLCRVFLSDDDRICEIYNPLKFENFFTDLPQQQFQKRRKLEDDDDFINSGQNSTTTIEEGSQDDSSEEKCEDESNSGPVYLPLTGSGDIRPYYDFVSIIAHQNTYDEQLLEKVKPNYLKGYSAERGVVKSLAAKLEPPLFDVPTQISFDGEFGRLSLTLIVFKHSRLVTVTLKWFMDDGIREGGGDRYGLQNDETYICGNVYVVGRDADQDEWSSVLLETPEDKVIKVVDGEDIVLMRSQVAVPFMSSFKIQAFLLDPISKIEFAGAASFTLAEENKAYKLSESIVCKGGGAKIIVEVSVHMN